MLLIACQSDWILKLLVALATRQPVARTLLDSIFLSGKGFLSSNEWQASHASAGMKPSSNPVGRLPTQSGICVVFL
jgi:hypothetical protein